MVYRFVELEEQSNYYCELIGNSSLNVTIWLVGVYPCLPVNMGITIVFS